MRVTVEPTPLARHVHGRQPAPGAIVSFCGDWLPTARAGARRQYRAAEEHVVDLGVFTQQRPDVDAEPRDVDQRRHDIAGGDERLLRQARPHQEGRPSTPSAGWWANGEFGPHRVIDCREFERQHISDVLFVIEGSGMERTG